MPKKKMKHPKTKQQTIDLQISVETEKSTGRVLAVYVKLGRGRIVRTEEYAPGLNVDIGVRGQVIGVELLHPHKVTIALLKQAAEDYNEPRLKLINPRAVAA